MTYKKIKWVIRGHIQVICMTPYDLCVFFKNDLNMAYVRPKFFGSHIQVMLRSLTFFVFRSYLFHIQVILGHQMTKLNRKKINILPFTAESTFQNTAICCAGPAICWDGPSIYCASAAIYCAAQQFAALAQHFLSLNNLLNTAICCASTENSCDIAAN